MGACVLALAAAASSAAAERAISPPTKEERLLYIRRGRVWEPTDVASKDLYNGPAGSLQLAVGEEVSCDFVPKLMAGLTEKFLCKLDDGRIFKVKYNEGDRFKEAVGEVLGTRLFWALGFYADTMRPVRVRCRNCPYRPWKYVRDSKNKDRLDASGELGPLPPEASVATYTIDPAAMEERLDVATIEREKDQGWWWSSLDDVDENEGGASRAQLDALKLLNAFVQNSDNKSRQNALACPRDALVDEGGGRVGCSRPILYVDDLGAVFGKGGFITGYDGRVHYEGWKKRRVFKSDHSCKTRLSGIGGFFRPSNLRNPRVGEAGRSLLAGELAQLSDAQIGDLFRASRIDTLHQTMRDGAGRRREVTIEDWVALFKAKRDEITHHAACEDP